MRRLLRVVIALVVLTPLALNAPTVAARRGAVLASVAIMPPENVCRPNPSPPDPNNAPIHVTSPTPGQAVPSPITVTGQAHVFEAAFIITLYDQTGAEVTTVYARARDGTMLSPFTASVPYPRYVDGQAGCLWLYTASPRDGSLLNIVQVPVLLSMRASGDPRTCFAEAGNVCIDARFQRYWLAHGDLYQFGYPLAAGSVEQLADGHSYFVQYFERARFEYHPENAPPYDVLLGLLGNQIASSRRTEEPFLPRPRPAQCSTTALECLDAGRIWFSQTGHYLTLPMATTNDEAGREFGTLYSRSGDLPVYGYPISEVFFERGSDGNRYQVQYFERYRLEYHPENVGSLYIVELGQLGRQIYDARPRQ